jgi:hypothetical protein
MGRAAISFALAISSLAALPAASIAQLERERASEGTSKAEVAAYWTPERMRRATSLDHPPAPHRSAVGVAPSARSATGGPGRGSPLLVEPTLPAPQRVGGAVAAGYPVANWRRYPQSTHGKLFGRLKGVGPYECSATVVAAANASTVLTAGHCVKQPRGAWARNLIFVPSYRKGRAPYGRWIWKAAWVNGAWARLANPNFDFGAVRMARRGGERIEDAVGARGVAFGISPRQHYRAFGYPRNKADGQRLWGCGSRLKRRDPLYIGPGPRPIGIRCDMSTGASGGGWIVRGHYLSSLTSFGYAGQPKQIYGPYFGGAAKRLWRDAGRR